MADQSKASGLQPRVFENNKGYWVSGVVPSGRTGLRSDNNELLGLISGR
jgi:hypothetical protein